MTKTNRMRAVRAFKMSDCDTIASDYLRAKARFWPGVESVDVRNEDRYFWTREASHRVFYVVGRGKAFRAAAVAAGFVITENWTWN